VTIYDGAYWQLSLMNNISIFIDNRIYSIKKYVYLVKMKNFYEWSLGVVCRDAFVIYHVSLTYYEDSHIALYFESTDVTARHLQEYLNIELSEILDGDI
jgi:hypothetical protein